MQNIAEAKNIYHEKDGNKLTKITLNPNLRQSHGNEYVSLQLSDNVHQLECVKFNGVEDLGDGIMCNRENQKIWVANYFVQHMQPA